ncbi:MAG: hypothetical protein WED11_00690, partial [Natronospirillum sp.]
LFHLWLLGLLVVVGTAWLQGALKPSYDRFMLYEAKRLDTFASHQIDSISLIRQPVNMLFTVTPSPKDLESTVCVNVLMANYEDRPNTGIFSVELNVDGKIHRRLRNACSVKDNAMQRTCFPGLTYEQIRGRQVFLDIRGVNGQVGSSVSALYTRDLYQGKAVENGVEVEGSLLFTLTTDRSSPSKLVIGLVLSLFFAGAALLLITVPRRA